MKLIDPANYAAIAKEAEDNFFLLKRNVQKLLKGYSETVCEYDKVKEEAAKLRARLDEMGKE